MVLTLFTNLINVSCSFIKTRDKFYEPIYLYFVIRRNNQNINCTSWGVIQVCSWIFYLIDLLLQNVISKLSLPIVGKNTRQRSSLPSVKKHSTKKLFIECKNKTLDKNCLCRVHFYQVFFVWHSAKNFFAECPKENARQNILHTTEMEFSIVIVISQKSDPLNMKDIWARAQAVELACLG
jgi:hypothetical protein